RDRMLKKEAGATATMNRELLEGLVARLATVAITKNPKLKKALLENRDAMRKSVKALDAGDAYTMANTQFHQLLLDAIESPQLERMVSQLQMPLYRMIYARLLAEPARLKSLSDHERIIEAILDNDPQRAEIGRAHV